jgi:hypothetical protein
MPAKKKPLPKLTKQFAGGKKKKKKKEKKNVKLTNKNINYLYYIIT